MIKVPALLTVLFIAAGLAAQTTSLDKRLALLEKSKASPQNIRELSQVLLSTTLGNRERLLVHTAIVHQYQELQQWDSCLHYCQQQIALAQQQQNKTAEAVFYKLLGNTCYHIPDKNKAVDYWKKCIAISETIGENLQLEQCYHNIGSVILETGANYPEAEQNFLKAIALSIANKTDTTELGNLHYRLLATLYTETGRLAKANELYSAVIARARQLNDSLRIAEALTFYTGLLTREKRFDNAVEAGKEALLISQKFNKLDMEQTALGYLSESYAAAGNFKDAYFYVLKQNELYQRRFHTDLNSKMSDAEARFKTSELQHENALAAVKAKKEKQIYFTAFLCLFLLAVFTLYYYYQKRSLKQKAEIQLQLQLEKERLSRDLHDNLGSQMALLINNIENLDGSYRKNIPVKEHIARVKEASRQLLQTLRETIWILHKKRVTAQDFFDKLVDYAHRFLQAYPQVKLDVSESFIGIRELNSNEALQLFRICQEAITNACKHANSECLKLHGQTDKGVFRISITDQGNGFDTDSKHAGVHYGLKNMQQRASEIAAELTIQAAKGKGVAIAIRL